MALRDCPLLRRAGDPAQALSATAAWIETHALSIPARDWLDGWERAPEAWLEHWCEWSPTLPARLLRECRDAARTMTTASPPLAVHADDGALAALAAALRADPGFVCAPLWLGAPAETGPWTRLNGAAAAAATNAWMRLGARLAEAVRLILPDARGQAGALWLRHGSLTLDDGEGLGWCEMARGLLVHRVRLDRARDTLGRVAECDVLAPTEWNFHPDGAVARGLARLPVDVDERTARVLAAAFDPCVEVCIVRAPAAECGDA